MTLPTKHITSLSPYTEQVFVGDYRCFGESGVSTFILPQDEDSIFLQKFITRVQCVINQKPSLKFQRYENHNFINATEDPWRTSNKSSDVQGSLLYVSQ